MLQRRNTLKRGTGTVSSRLEAMFDQESLSPLVPLGGCAMTSTGNGLARRSMLKDTIEQGGDRQSGKADLIGDRAKPIRVREGLATTVSPLCCSTWSLKGVCADTLYIYLAESSRLPPHSFSMSI